MPPLSTMGPLLFLLLGGANAALFMRGGGANRNKRGRQQDHAINVVEQALDAAGAAPRKPSADDAASTHFYDSAVKDHFTTSIATAKEPKWSQRYYVDSTFWKGEGYPVFLYIGGEGPQSAPSSRLFMWTLAEQHGALMISLEHRYYGESWPTPEAAGPGPLMTHEQALADFSSLIYSKCRCVCYSPL